MASGNSSPLNSKKRKISPDDSPTPRKSTKFWFDDGNLVLQTDDTLYRVHRSVLKTHSTVFADMFTLPQPAADPTDVIVEGCPVVPVDDSSKDWDVLLGILYGTASVFWENTRLLTYGAMIPMLRLGYKYNLAQVKADALQNLKTMFPSSYEEWRHPQLGLPELMDSANHEFECVHLIEKLGIQSTLPMVYYACVAWFPLKKILDGRDAPDGPVFLSQGTKETLILGSNALTRKAFTEFSIWLDKKFPAEGCPQKHECKDIIMNSLIPTFSRIGEDGPLYNGSLLRESPLGLCVECTISTQSAIAERGRRIFNDLPTYFNLPGWDQLKDF